MRKKIMLFIDERPVNLTAFQKHYDPLYKVIVANSIRFLKHLEDQNIDLFVTDETTWIKNFSRKFYFWQELIQNISRESKKLALAF